MSLAIAVRNRFLLRKPKKPMVYVRYAFTDYASGKLVGYYEDEKGKIWLAQNATSRFRIKTKFRRSDVEKLNQETKK